MCARLRPLESAGGIREIIGPHQTVDLVGTVWARTGFKTTGAPLAAGNYAINLGDQYGTDQFQPQFPAPEFTVTAS